MSRWCAARISRWRRGISGRRTVCVTSGVDCSKGLPARPRTPRAILESRQKTGEAVKTLTDLSPLETGEFSSVTKVPVEAP
jgi:hypothetical protein